MPNWTKRHNCLFYFSLEVVVVFFCHVTTVFVFEENGRSAAAAARAAVSKLFSLSLCMQFCHTNSNSLQNIERRLCLVFFPRALPARRAAVKKISAAIARCRSVISLFHTAVEATRRARGSSRIRKLACMFSKLSSPIGCTRRRLGGWSRSSSIHARRRRS